MSLPPSENPPTRGTPGNTGFGYTRRKIAIEAGSIVFGLLALGAGLWWLASHLAEWLADQLPLEVDTALGEQAFTEVAPPSKRCSNPETQAYVEAVAKPLVDNADSAFTFRFVVVDQPEVNAFALPGGFVAVNFGLLQQAETGEEVAAVLAHELMHVTERHGTRRIARQLGAMVVLSVVLGGSDYESLGLLAAGFANTAYDRDQEADADSLGRALLMRAGISPAGMADFFARMDRNGVSVPAFLSTHPDPGDRAEAAREAASGFTPTASLPKPDGLACN